VCKAPGQGRDRPVASARWLTEKEVIRSGEGRIVRTQRRHGAIGLRATLTNRMMIARRCSDPSMIVSEYRLPE
jgi:hypothetical protein